MSSYPPARLKNHLRGRDSSRPVSYTHLRILRTNIEFNKKGLEEISLTFVSGSAGEGKTTTLCNLAYICLLYTSRCV